MWMNVVTVSDHSIITLNWSLYCEWFIQRDWCSRLCTAKFQVYCGILILKSIMLFDIGEGWMSCIIRKILFLFSCNIHVANY